MRRMDAEAVDFLIHRYPHAAEYFGEFPSIEHFALAITGPDWIVIEENLNWVFFEVIDSDTANVHWFCPTGADIKTLRDIIDSVFAAGVKRLQGVTPPDKRFAAAARFLNRALGAEKEGDLYVLTRERFVKYNRSRAEA